MKLCETSKFIETTKIENARNQIGTKQLIMR